MKCLLIYFFFVLVIFSQINQLKQSKLKINIKEQKKFYSIEETKNLIRCKLCQEMIEYDFNYDNLIKENKKISKLQDIFEKLNKFTKSGNKENYSLENLEIFAKEISMEYFFKGEDAIFSPEQKNDKTFVKEYDSCKKSHIGLNESCDLKKLRVCENILNINGNSCLNNYNAISYVNENEKSTKKEENKINNNNKEIENQKKYSKDYNVEKFEELLNKLDNKSKIQNDIKKKIADFNIKIPNYSPIEKLNQIIKNNDLLGKENNYMNEISEENIDIGKLIEKAQKEENFKKLLKNHINNIKDFEKIKNFKQKNFLKLEEKEEDSLIPERDISHAELSSYLELTPDYIKNNFDSVPKKKWSPPKPVLLENFENNIGSQLKEISSLASEIARNENRIKIMKQKLANKIEQFQSSYNVIQKTISEISKLVKTPSFPSLIKSPSSFTEDDWDEKAKPKFLNR